MMILDTTVLVYAKGADHPLRESCRRLVEAVADGRIEATTTPEVIQEFVHVRARRRGRDDAAALGAAFATALAPLVSVEGVHLDRGLELFAVNERLGAFDSVLAAVAIATGARLVSADAAFSGVPGLSHATPDSLLEPGE